MSLNIDRPILCFMTNGHIDFRPGKDRIGVSFIPCKYLGEELKMLKYRYWVRRVVSPQCTAGEEQLLLSFW